jgi:ribosome maturation factor RimP
MDIVLLQHEVRELLEPAVVDLGYELIGVEWVGSRRGPVLRLSVDSPSGVNAQDCASISERVSPVLDVSDPIDARYTLEVSSPGIERPVQRSQDFERFKGYRAKIRLIEGLPRRRYTGEIVGTMDDELVVDVDGKEHRLSLETVERVNLDLTLSQYQALVEETKNDQ